MEVSAQRLGEKLEETNNPLLAATAYLRGSAHLKQAANEGFDEIDAVNAYGTAVNIAKMSKTAADDLPPAQEAQLEAVFGEIPQEIKKKFKDSTPPPKQPAKMPKDGTDGNTPQHQTFDIGRKGTYLSS